MTKHLFQIVLESNELDIDNEWDLLADVKLDGI